MADPKTPRVLDAVGPAAPPRKNGELVFDEVWEGRLFGLTMALYDSGAFAWDEFRDLLIDEIGQWERAHPSGADYHYYERWLGAFERLVTEKGLCAKGDLSGRRASLAARPAGHDH
ncbi:MAG: nitrile hydratase accessory protein [Candidatus Binatia bacterium]|nr:nitrile hydratase accessory protein [Candidatus Binatia bacterium]